MVEREKGSTESPCSETKNALVTADTVPTGIGDRWIFGDFADSPDTRFRKIVKRFADAGYMEAECDEFVAA
jgi:hypothetical protein